MKEDRFEWLEVPNDFGTNDEAEIEIVCSFATYEEAYEDMMLHIKADEHLSTASDYHYDIWEYDDDDIVINEWQFDYHGNPRR